ncbi:MAG TPA: substrate-binding domain-containing protein, partial [Flavisolibacter sp.]|nr:substrate-binding domain-containing protein [Flavisolibacter sp.]
KLITPLYTACGEAGLSIPGDIKVIGFSKLQTASILNPSLTTVTQPAFEMGRAASAILFEALLRPDLNLVKQSVVIPSVLEMRDSTL